MAAQKKPTNSDIYQAIGAIQNDLKAIHKQVKETNGRVTALEKREGERQAVESYIEREGIKSPQEEKEGRTELEKILIAVVTILVAVLSTLIGSGQL